MAQKLIIKKFAKFFFLQKLFHNAMVSKIVSENLFLNLSSLKQSYHEIRQNPPD